MNIKLLNTNAKLPSKNLGNAGYDLYSVENVIVSPLERKIISTGISIVIPVGFYGHICDRSGMAYKNGGTVLAGIIDETYRGEIKIILYNTDKEKPIEIKIGDRPAQIIFKHYYDFDFNIVEELDITDRNENGFGSTGT